MTARLARFSDIPSLMVLLRQCHESSAVAGVAEIDEGQAENIMMQIIGAHDAQAQIGAVVLFVTGEIGDVTGMIAGTVQPMYMALSLPMVTDFLWYVDPDRARPRDGSSLLESLHAWADTLGVPVRRRHMVNDMVMNPSVTGRMMRRKGYRLAGLVFEKEA